VYSPAGSVLPLSKYNVIISIKRVKKLVLSSTCKQEVSYEVTTSNDRDCCQIYESTELGLPARWAAASGHTVTIISRSFIAILLGVCLYVCEHRRKSPYEAIQEGICII
jgi:hypothetical protein